MLKLCGYDLANASDFEKLSMWCQCVSIMPDNAARLIFLEEIEALLGEKAEPLNACELWKKCNSSLTFQKDLVVDILRDNNVNRVIYSNKSSIMADIPTNAVFDTGVEIDLLSEVGEKTFTEWGEDIICAFKKKRPPYDIAVDIRNIDFVRGDHYHAGIAFDKLKAGDDISSIERGQLFFWLVCDIASNLGEDAVFHLNIGSNISCAKELIAYLCMRNICPKIAIGVSPEGAGYVKNLVEICLLSPDKINLELVLGIEDTPRVLSQRLEALLAFYPASRLKFGGVLTDSAVLYASHRYARKVICQAISEIADDNAEDIVSSIFS
jgi:hypothetical protein